jgi:hypothetical protein
MLEFAISVLDPRAARESVKSVKLVEYDNL